MVQASKGNTQLEWLTVDMLMDFSCRSFSEADYIVAALNLCRRQQTAIGAYANAEGTSNRE